MKKSILICCTLVTMLGANLIAQPQLDTLRHIHPRPGTGLSAIWGYTARDGREYALVGITGSASVSGGTSIVDITVDTLPRVVTHIVGPNSTWREIKTYKQYAYVVTESGSGSGVQIINLQGLPDTAVLVRTFPYFSGSKNINRSHSISIIDGFMYLNGCAGWSPGGILIFDLRSDPINPTFVSEYQPRYIHDSYILRDTIYASAINGGGGLVIANAKNKASVQTISQIIYTGSGTHNAWVSKDRRYALTTDEIGTTAKNLKIWDIGNLPAIPAAPIATFTVNPTSTIHNVHVRGDYAYCAWYNGYGLQIVDVRNPAAPGLAAGWRTSTNSLAWDTYPYFPSGKVILGDGSTGLWIFRFSELKPRIPVQLLGPANNDTVHTGATQFNWTKSANIAEDPHGYEVRLRGPGLDTTWQSDDSVTTFDDPSRFQSGQRYWWSVITRDQWNSTNSPDSSAFVFEPTTGVNDGQGIPYSFRLHQNFPNPFNPSTRISYELGAKSHVTVRIFNVLGEQVAELVNSTQPAGQHTVTFDARGLSSGLYFYRLDAGEFTTTKKMMLLQ